MGNSFLPKRLGHTKILAVSGFELRASCLLGRYSAILTMYPALYPKILNVNGKTLLSSLFLTLHTPLP
jgi:hypothetical protein